MTLLPPELSMSKPSGPIIKSLGGGWELLGSSVPLTWYASMMVTGWVWFCKIPVSV